MADLGWCSKHKLVGEDDSSCCSRCWAEINAEAAAGKRAVEDALRSEGREDERRDVVAWLRSKRDEAWAGVAPVHPGEMRVLRVTADCIEACQHIGAAAKDGK